MLIFCIHNMFKGRIWRKALLQCIRSSWRIPWGSVSLSELCTVKYISNLKFLYVHFRAELTMESLLGEVKHWEVSSAEDCDCSVRPWWFAWLMFLTWQPELGVFARECFPDFLITEGRTTRDAGVLWLELQMCNVYLRSSCMRSNLDQGHGGGKGRA